MFTKLYDTTCLRFYLDKSSFVEYRVNGLFGLKPLPPFAKEWH